MVLIWLFYPATYDYGTALNDSHYFYRTQRVGVLPDTSVPWRSNSLLQEYAIPFSAKNWDFGGGWMTVRLPALRKFWSHGGLHDIAASCRTFSPAEPSKVAILHNISHA